MRDILAALLRSRGYTHDDERDPNDLFWSSPTLGVRTLVVCIQHEINRDPEHNAARAISTLAKEPPTPSNFCYGYETIKVSVPIFDLAYKERYSA